MSLKRAFLEVVSGPGQGRRIPLRQSQERYIGRTDQADASFPDNSEMSSVHFKARWLGAQCEIKDLQSANGTHRGGKKITEALLGPGEEVRAGKAVFRLIVEDETGDRLGSVGPDTAIESGRTGELPASLAAIQSAGPPAAEKPAELEFGLAIASATEVCQFAPLEDEAKAMLVEEQPVLQFIDLLASREEFIDALRVVAYALTKRSAVDWACRCIHLGQGDDLSPKDAAALAAAEAWVAKPNEENRRTAGAAGEAAAYETAASWAATAAFWSFGSLTPPNLPVVPPQPTLTPHAASGAAMLAAAAKEPEKIEEKYLQFLQLGKEMMTNGSPK